MSRDKQSLEEIKGYDDSYWLRYLAENTIFDTENIKAQKDWLINRLAAEKERADKAEEREEELKCAIAYVMENNLLYDAPYAYEHFEEILDSLYPKEEEA